MFAPEGFLKVAGQQLELRFLTGEPGKPILLLLHEGLGCVSMWRDFPAIVHKATGCSVLLWSRAGYGKSSPRALPWPLTYMQDEARDVVPQIIALLDGHPHVLVGHSDGASIATIYAGSAALPGLAGLVLMAPHVFVEDVSISGIEAARKAWRESNLRELLQRHHGGNADCAFHGWNDSWLHHKFRGWDITRALPNITVPALVIQGRNDEYGTLAQIDTIAERSGGRVDKLVLEACGHSPQKDQTAAVVDAISSFISEL